MVCLDPYFALEGARRPAYLGQLDPAFQLALAERYSTVREADCVFTQTLLLPDGGAIDGEVDMRGSEESYLGSLGLWGQRVVEFFPGSGWLSAYIAVRSRELLVFDAPLVGQADGGGPKRRERVRCSWWFAKQRLDFEALAVYADINNPPDDLGKFDSAILRGVLTQVVHPYLVLCNVAAITHDTIVVAESLDTHDRSAKSPSEPPLVMFVPPEKAGGVARWRLSVAAVQHLLASVGFARQTITFYTQMYGHTSVPHYTIVARRAATARLIVATSHPGVQAAQRQPLTSNEYGAKVAATPPAAAADEALDRVDDALPLPNAQGRFLVAGTDDVEVFVTLGRAGFKALFAALQRAAVELSDLGRVLDFGCGVGRVLRYWQSVPEVAMHGTDLNAEAIAWGRENLPFATLATNTLEPILDYPTGHFGFVYALSVFTHLPEAMQRPFLSELLRVLRPGGHLYFTTHGVSYRGMLTPEMRSTYDRNELAVGGGDDPGSNYCGAFHPVDYVRKEMLDPCNAILVEFLAEGALGNPTQDSWLIRKP